jgi:hypothetical protein
MISKISSVKKEKISILGVMQQEWLGKIIKEYKRFRHN